MKDYVIVTASGRTLHQPSPTNPDFATKCGERGKTYAWSGRVKSASVCKDCR